eukprot:TRINITY_DN217_c0_g1_i1.p1 TRINITY_DN217_c0_g1~~TRINITY_DN217_c0_g1_i1.p1  ORF type:complete len:419 (-),score=114.91 TRINITY_DN217_c0_g1_i1:75-1331(-)
MATSPNLNQNRLQKSPSILLVRKPVDLRKAQFSDSSIIFSPTNSNPELPDCNIPFINPVTNLSNSNTNLSNSTTNLSNSTTNLSNSNSNLSNSTTNLSNSNSNFIVRISRKEEQNSDLSKSKSRIFKKSNLISKEEFEKSISTHTTNSDNTISFARAKLYPSSKEGDGNCDQSLASDDLPIALILDGVGHDRIDYAPIFADNAKLILKVLEESLRNSNEENVDEFKEQLLENLLNLEEYTGDQKEFQHVCSTLSVAIKIKIDNQNYVLTYNWGDSVILKLNKKEDKLEIIEQARNTDYGIGIVTNEKGKLTKIDDDDLIIGLSDGALVVFSNVLNNSNNNSNSTQLYELNKLNEFYKANTNLFSSAETFLRETYEKAKNLELTTFDDISIFIMKENCNAHSLKIKGNANRLIENCSIS